MSKPTIDAGAILSLPSEATAHRPKRILVAYSMTATFVSTTMEYLRTLKNFSPYEVHYIHVTHDAGPNRHRSRSKKSPQADPVLMAGQAQARPGHLPPAIPTSVKSAYRVGERGAEQTGQSEETHSPDA